MTERASAIIDPELLEAISAGTVRLLTIWQPWATLLAIEAKTIETRSHGRGQTCVGKWVAIHAAAAWTAEGKAAASEDRIAAALARYGYRAAASSAPNPTRYGMMPLGAIVGFGKLASIEPMTAENTACLSEDELAMGWFRPGRFNWRFTDMHRPASPIKAKGGQAIGFWRADDVGSLGLMRCAHVPAA